MSERDAAKSDKPGQTNGRRKTLILGVLFLFAAAGIAYAVWWALVGRYAETTDDAYVGGNVVQITPQIAGTVVAIAADDTEFVSAGQTLVELDKADGKVALERTETELARAVRQIRNLTANTAELEAGVALRRSELVKAREDVARRERAAPSGAVSLEEVQHARDALAGATAALDASEKALAAQRMLVDRTTVATHPDVLAAAARVREAYLNFARSAVLAPVSGYVAKRNVQVGQRVAPGAPLMTVVPLDQVWVDANFKEVQLNGLRIGQPVRLTADLYGSDVVFHGKVAGFGAGTGSAFALLPPQNATGNWIKIIQRVPVRIALDAQELSRNPLQLGLSMQVSVDTHTRDGERMPKQVRQAQAHQASALPSLDALAAQRIAAIISAQGGDPVSARSR